VFQEFFFKDFISLKAIQDPGQTVVWYSFLSMMAGFSVMFFFSYTRIWARVEKKGDECVITLGGTATKNLDSLKKAINTLHAVLKERVQ
jgi:cytochrome c biogenesis protein ResB